MALAVPFAYAYVVENTALAIGLALFAGLLAAGGIGRAVLVGQREGKDGSPGGFHGNHVVDGGGREAEQEALAAGTFFRARAEALMTMSLTDTLTPSGAASLICLRAASSASISASMVR